MRSVKLFFKKFKKMIDFKQFERIWSQNPVVCFPANTRLEEKETRASSIVALLFRWAPWLCSCCVVSACLYLRLLESYLRSKVCFLHSSRNSVFFSMHLFSRFRHSQLMHWKHSTRAQTVMLGRGGQTGHHRNRFTGLTCPSIFLFRYLFSRMTGLSWTLASLKV